MKRSSCLAMAVVLALVVSMVIPLVVGAQEDTVTIRARKYEDVSRNGTHDTGEPYLQGWEISLWAGRCSLGSCAQVLGSPKDTDDDGWAVWSGLTAGNYTICEYQEPGWSNTQPGGSIGPYRCYEHEFAAGDDETFLFGNYELGTITVCKDSIPDDGQSFNFTRDGGTGDFTLLDDGSGTGNCTTFTHVAPGVYNITEEDPAPGWDVTAINIAGDDDYTSGDTVTRNATVVVDPGEDIVVTFENTKRGSITVCKDTTPYNEQDFHFTSDMPNPNDDFYLDDDLDGTLPKCAGPIVLPAGIYNITEEDPSPGWDLTSLGIQESWDGSWSVFDFNNRRVEVHLDPGEQVTVRFQNTEWGTIVIYKDVVSIHTETDDFDFTGDLGDFALDDDGIGDNYAWFQQAPGTYNVTELVPAGWDLTDITIVDPTADSSSDLEAATASLDLSLNEAVTCHFENTKRGSIIVEKNTRGGPDGSFTFTGDVAGSIGGGGQLEEDNLVPGEYTVRELVPTGWELSSIRCDDDNSSGSVGTGTATINLDPGETVTCTYTNSYLAGTPGLPRKHPGAVGRPEPAGVLACYLDVPVVEALPGQQFDISVNLCNRGGEKATKSVDLLINGHQEQSQTVGLGPGACQTVVFRVFKTVPGTYEVSVMGQVGYFTIMPLYPGYVVTQGPAQEAGGIGTAGIVTIVVVVIVLAGGLVLILRRE